MGRLEDFLRNNKININDADDVKKLEGLFADGPVNGSYIINDLVKFCKTEPVMPSDEKSWCSPNPINLEGIKSAEDARESLKAQRGDNETVDLAFMAFRDLSSSPWKPFLKAAVERNPVCLSGTDGMTVGDAYKCLTSPLFADESIYGGQTRLAQPDEVWNYKRGDGLEKAVALATIYINKGGQPSPENGVKIDIGGKNVKLACGNREFLFGTGKELAPPRDQDWIF
jgi:hypothetical protein